MIAWAGSGSVSVVWKYRILGAGLTKNNNHPVGVRWATFPPHGGNVWVGEVLINPSTGDPNPYSCETRGYILIKNPKVPDEKTALNRIISSIDEIALFLEGKNLAWITIVPFYRRHHIFVKGGRRVMFLVVKPSGSNDFPNPKDSFEVVGEHYVKHSSSGEVYPIYISISWNDSRGYMLDWEKSDKSVAL